MNKRILITAALPYANGDLHLGHIAGCYLNADIRNRFEKLMGNKTLFLSGSDSYGSAISMSASKQNVRPDELAAKYHKEHGELFDILDINFDIFSSTLCSEHEPTVLSFFDAMFKKGLVEEQYSLQFYDPEREEFLADRFITGTCPYCNNENARGDECSKCGRSFPDNEIKNPRAALFGNKLVLKQTKHFYMKMSKYKHEITCLIKNFNWTQQVKAEALGVVQNLKDRCITRSLSWGIPVPSKYKSYDSNARVFYVWFDALIGYISITKEFFKNSGNSSLWKKYWMDRDSKIINFMGKDNIMFHAVMFPIMEMMYDSKMHIVDEICANNFFLIHDLKFSKSDGVDINMTELFKTFDKNEIRFYIASNSPESADVACSVDLMKEETNKVLVGKIGNFINRVLVFVKNNIGNDIPKDFHFEKSEFFQSVNKFSDQIKLCYSKSKVRNAVKKIREFSDNMNQYFDFNKPWLLIKEQNKLELLHEVLTNCLVAINSLSVFLAPTVPCISLKISEMLGEASGLKNGNTWDQALQVSWSRGVLLGNTIELITKKHKS